MFHVLLFEPEIPGNTGNVIRLCANTGADRRVSDLALAPGECLLFGPESRGLPPDVGAGLDVPLLRASLPMRPANRSLNLANAVAVTVYEAWRQNGFGEAATRVHPIRTPP